MTTERDWRRWARDVEYHASMAAFENFRAGEIVASMDGPTEREQLQQMTALDYIARVRQCLREITYPASERGYGRQGRLSLGGAVQLELLSA